MKHNLIKTDDYLLILSDEEIKDGDWFYNNVLNQCIKAVGVWEDKVKHLNSNLDTFKVISHLPLNGAQVLEDVPLLPPLEDEVEKLAEDYNIEFQLSHGSKPPHIKNTHIINHFKFGYNKAKEKYKYTEEDLRKAIEMAQECSICECFLGPHIEREHTEKSIIQSLQHHPKYPIAFECEVITRVYDVYPQRTERKPKTITNSQGRTEWVGKYIYE